MTEFKSHFEIPGLSWYRCSYMAIDYSDETVCVLAKSAEDALVFAAQFIGDLYSIYENGKHESYKPRIACGATLEPHYGDKLRKIDIEEIRQRLGTDKAVELQMHVQLKQS